MEKTSVIGNYNGPYGQRSTVKCPYCQTINTHGLVKVGESRCCDKCGKHYEIGYGYDNDSNTTDVSTLSSDTNERETPVKHPRQPAEGRYCIIC